MPYMGEFTKKKHAGLTADADLHIPKAHHTSHEAGGSDPISGIPASAHHASHENGGSDEISVAGLSGALADAQTPSTHKTSHENGGADEISVAGLSGELADNQPPKAHHTSHENGGADEISLAGLSGEAADPQPPKLTVSSASSTGDQNVTTMDSWVDVTSLTLTLAAGKWVVVANLDILWYDSLSGHTINLQFLDGDATAYVTMTYMNDRGGTDFQHGYCIVVTVSFAASKSIKVQIKTNSISGNKYVRVKAGSSIYALGG